MLTLKGWESFSISFMDTTVTFIVWKSWIIRKSIKVFTLGMSKRLFKIHAMLGLMRKFICK